MDPGRKVYLDEKFGVIEERIAPPIERFEASLTAAFRDLGTPADVRCPSVSDILQGIL